MEKIIWLCLFCLMLSIELSAQTKEITREEYYQPFRNALANARKVSRRITTQMESYREGKSDTIEEYIYEYDKANNQRYIHTTKSADKVRRLELIKIGETYYCRYDDGAWKQSKSWCGNGSAFGLPNVITSKFTVTQTKLNNQSVKLYEEYTTYKNIYSPNKDKEGLSYWQNKFWLNEDGLIVRKESSDGLQQPEKINWKQTEISEYNPKDLKIEAPIK